MRTAPLVARLAIVVAVFASILGPAWIAPARTLSFPETLARSLHLRSDQGRATFGFEATHIAFSWTGEEGTGVRYRLVRADGVRHRWTRAPESHDLEHGERHYSAVIAVPDAVALEWRAAARKGIARDVILDYLNTVDGPRRTFDVPTLARATAKTPRIVTRAEWGADESVKSTSGGCRRVFYPVQQLFVHHTAGSNFDADPRATMRAIYWYHTVRRGWCDLGYNFVIGANGTIFEGRWARSYAPWEVHDSESRAGYAVAGAHVSGYNSGSVGISLMGNFMRVEPTPAARRSLAELLAWEADRHNLRPKGFHTYKNPETGRTRYLPYIAGHRDAGYTSCPGDLLYASLPQVRRDTKAVIGAGKASSFLTMTASTPSVSYGDAVTVSGTLTDENGSPLGGRSITIYRLDAGRSWIVGGEATTGLEGTYSFSFVPDRNVRLIAVYSGDNELWGSSSGVARVGVHPDVTLAPEGAQFDATTGTYSYPAGTTLVPLSGDVAPAHPGSTVRVVVNRVNDDGSLTLLADTTVKLDRVSHYRFDYSVPGPGTYRARTAFRRDADHRGSASDPVTFVVQE